MTTSIIETDRKRTENGPEAAKVQTMIYNQVPLRKEYIRVVKWVRALSLTLVAPVRIPVVCQSMIGVAYIQLTISNICETGIGLAYSLRTSLISKRTSSYYLKLPWHTLMYRPSFLNPSLKNRLSNASKNHKKGLADV